MLWTKITTIFGILHITPKVLYTFGGIIPEKWGHCSNKCKLENEGCPIFEVIATVSRKKTDKDTFRQNGYQGSIEKQGIGEKN